MDSTDHRPHQGAASCVLCMISNTSPYKGLLQAACAHVAGDSVLGYDLEHANLADPDLDKWIARGGSPPDVILVRRLHRPWHPCTVNMTRCTPTAIFAVSAHIQCGLLPSGVPIPAGLFA